MSDPTFGPVEPTEPREGVGRLVRQVWTEWAREQPAPKLSWLLPWEELDDGQREVDMRIGAVLFDAGARSDAITEPVVTYLRWKPGVPRECLVSPLTDRHPAFNTPCLICDEPLGNGGPIQLFALGPDSEETRQKHTDGRWYSARAVVLHAECLGPDTEPLLGREVPDWERQREISALAAEIDRLQLQIQGYQTSDSYNKGHEHGSATAEKLAEKNRELRAELERLQTPSPDGPYRVGHHNTHLVYSDPERGHKTGDMVAVGMSSEWGPLIADALNAWPPALGTAVGFKSDGEIESPGGVP